MARRAQRGRFGTCLLGESVCHDNIVRIPWLFPNVVRNIRWSGGARLILKASQIGLYLIKVGFELDLMGKGDVWLGKLVKAVVGGAVYHYPAIWIRLQLRSYSRGQNYPEFYTISCLFPYLIMLDLQLHHKYRCSVRLTLAFQCGSKRFHYRVEWTVLETQAACNHVSFGHQHRAEKPTQGCARRKRVRWHRYTQRRWSTLSGYHLRNWWWLIMTVRIRLWRWKGRYRAICCRINELPQCIITDSLASLSEPLKICYVLRHI